MSIIQNYHRTFFSWDSMLLFLLACCCHTLRFCVSSCGRLPSSSSSGLFRLSSSPWLYSSLYSFWPPFRCCLALQSMRLLRLLSAAESGRGAACPPYALYLLSSIFSLLTSFFLLLSSVFSGLFGFSGLFWVSANSCVLLFFGGRPPFFPFSRLRLLIFSKVSAESSILGRIAENKISDTGSSSGTSPVRAYTKDAFNAFPAQSSGAFSKTLSRRTNIFNQLINAFRTITPPPFRGRRNTCRIPPA